MLFKPRQNMHVRDSHCSPQRDLEPRNGGVRSLPQSSFFSSKKVAEIPMNDKLIIETVFTLSL